MDLTDADERYQQAKREAKVRVEAELAALNPTKAQAKVVRRQYFRGGPTDVNMKVVAHSQLRFKGHIVLVFSGSFGDPYAFRIDPKGEMHKCAVPGAKRKWEYSRARQIDGDDGYHWSVWDITGGFRVDGLTRPEVDYYRRQVEARHS